MYAQYSAPLCAALRTITLALACSHSTHQRSTGNPACICLILTCVFNSFLNTVFTGFCGGMENGLRAEISKGGVASRNAFGRVNRYVRMLSSYVDVHVNYWIFHAVTKIGRAATTGSSSVSKTTSFMMTSEPCSVLELFMIFCKSLTICIAWSKR